MPTDGDKLRKLRKGPRDDERERHGWLPGLDAPFVHLDIVECKLDGCLPQERAFLLVGLRQRQVPLRASERERYSGQAGAGAGVGDAGALRQR